MLSDVGDTAADPGSAAESNDSTSTTAAARATAVVPPLSFPDPDAVLAAFGIGGRAVTMTPVAGAWSNHVYRLQATTGTFAVKEMRNPWRDPGWLDWLAAAWEFEQLALASGVAMPEPVPNRSDGGPLAWIPTACADYAPGDECSVVPVRLHRWVDGAALGPGAVSADVAGWAGRTVARLHGLAVRPAERGLFPGPAVSVQTADRWPELAELVAQAGVSWAGQVLGVLPAVSEIARLARCCNVSQSAEVMTHGDVDQKNVVITPRGPMLCDWDLAMPMMPRRELADVAMSLAGWAEPGIARAVVRAYRAAGGEADGLGPEDLGQSLMTGLDWIAFNICRAVGTRAGTAAETARSSQLVPGLLADLPAHVEAALRASELLRG
jgi:Ser/Thr protein kinase RdoA (MazF antagonist)